MMTNNSEKTQAHDLSSTKNRTAGFAHGSRTEDHETDLTQGEQSTRESNEPVNNRFAAPSCQAD
jgi:hypothetical protein